METFYIQMILGGFSAVVGGIVSWIGWKLQKADKRREELEKKRLEEQERKEAQRETKFAAMQEAILAILRDRLIESTTECEKAKAARVYQVENVTHMYHAYEALGGNGTVKHMYEKFKALPITGGDTDGKDSER